MTTDREKRLEVALAQFLQPMKGIPFEVVIQALCGATVEHFDLDNHKNRSALDKIVAAMRETCHSVQANPIERPRPNEVGNDMEPFVISALKAQGMDAAAPKTKSGKGKTTGYPDIKIAGLPVPIFLEVKTYAGANHTTTQRSFYLSPAEDHKVTDDGYQEWKPVRPSRLQTGRSLWPGLRHESRIQLR